MSQAEGFETLADGTIRDDLFEDRPGLQAIKELSVSIPLAAAGLTKKEIKILGRILGLPREKFRPQACLATRFLPGEEITREGIQQVKRAENFLKSLGFQVFRVRIRQKEALLQIAPEEGPLFWAQKEYLFRALKGMGFQKVLFDLQAYRR